MKDFCVDFELAKELKENGFPQKTEFKWCEDKNNYPEQWIVYDTVEMGCSKDIVCSAPISEEIFNKLPKYIEYNNGVYDKNVAILHIILQRTVDNKSEYAIYYQDDYDLIIFDKKLPNALAKIYIYLKKEGYIK